MRKIALLMMLIISTSSFAQNAVLLDKGDEAPFIGTLVKRERLSKLIKAERKVIVLKDLQIAQETLIEYHRADSKFNRRRLSEAKFDSWTSNVGFFVLGVLLTGFAVKVNQKIGDM